MLRSRRRSKIRTTRSQASNEEDPAIAGDDVFLLRGAGGQLSAQCAGG